MIYHRNMVCFRYIIVNTVHKGDNKDDDDNDNDNYDNDDDDCDYDDDDDDDDDNNNNDTTHVSVQYSPSSEADVISTKCIPNILWNPIVHYLVHISPLLVPALMYISQVHCCHPISFRSI